MYSEVLEWIIALVQEEQEIRARSGRLTRDERERLADLRELQVGAWAARRLELALQRGRTTRADERRVLRRRAAKWA